MRDGQNNTKIDFVDMNWIGLIQDRFKLFDFMMTVIRLWVL
jgi:hypothetical protein